MEVSECLSGQDHSSWCASGRLGMPGSRGCISMPREIRWVQHIGCLGLGVFIHKETFGCAATSEAVLTGALQNWENALEQWNHIVHFGCTWELCNKPWPLFSFLFSELHTAIPHPICCIFTLFVLPVQKSVFPCADLSKLLQWRAARVQKDRCFHQKWLCEGYEIQKKQSRKKEIGRNTHLFSFLPILLF